jgi:hypothetical protein
MNGMNGGWIKLHRKLLDSPIWANLNLLKFWIWCLLKASYQSIAVKDGLAELSLRPGQFLYTHGEASAQTGLSQKVVRVCVEILGREMGIKMGRIKGSKKSILTVLNWESYQGDDVGEGKEKGSIKGREMGRSINKEDKKLKKHTGVATGSDPTASPTWQQWIAACRATGRDDPAPSDGALKAAKTLASWHPDLSQQRLLMDAFLALDDPWVKRQGYQLALLTKHRIEAVREIVRNGTGATQKPGNYIDPDDAWEASPEMLADFEELVCRKNRERDGLDLVDGKLVRRENANEHRNEVAGTVSA